MRKILSALAQKMKANGLLNTKGELLLYGIIGDWFEGLDALTIVREMEAMEADTIVVRIHSPGGSVAEGLAMYNALRSSAKAVHVHVDGLCASIATVIAMAADKGHLYTPDNALWMIHKAHAVVQGNDDQLRDSADALTTVNESMIAAYSAGGRVSEARVREIFASNKDHYMTGAEAVSDGFADAVTQSVKAAAHVDMSELAAPQGAHKALYEFYAVNAALTPQATHEEPSMKMKQLLALMAALTVQGIAADDINGVLARVFGCAATDVDATLAAQGKLNDEQVQAGLDALAALKPQPAPAAQPADVQAAIAAERKRQADINALADKHSLPVALRSSLLNDGATVEQARAQALDFLATADRTRQPVPGVRMVDGDEPAFRAGMANAMMNRMAPGAFKLEEGGRDFRGMTLLDMARACLERAGHNTRGMSRPELAAKALHSTSDFPYIVQDVANKVLLRAYQAQPRTFLPVANQVSLADFKLKHAIEIGGGSSLEQVNEAGEFNNGTVTEGKRSYKLSTYGKIFALTRQLLINDDVGAFSQFMQNIGALAARKESDVVWSLVKTGAIFTSGNKNLVASGGAVDETQLDKARKLLRQQVGLDNEPINVAGKYLVVNSERETSAQKLLSAVLAASTSNVNPFANSLELIVEPLLDGVANNPWYVFADPMLVPTLEYAYLEGESGPYIETKSGFEVDGIQIKVRHDFGAGWVSHRGAVKNPGA